jgi:hypothetical protein
MKSNSIVILIVLMLALPFAIYGGYRSFLNIKYKPEEEDYYSNLWRNFGWIIFILFYFGTIVLLVINIFN